MATSTQSAIIAALKGQTLCIPDLTTFFKTWPAPRSNPNCAAVTPLVNKTILSIATRHPPIEKRLRDDIALLTSLCYPTALGDRLEALAVFMVWIVCWDDTLDGGDEQEENQESGDSAADFTRAAALRADTLDHIKSALGLDRVQLVKEDVKSDPLVAILWELGGRLTEAGMSVLDRERLLNQLRVYVQGCSTEHRTRLDGIVPDYDTYIQFRAGTVGGGVFCALVPFALQVAELPEALADSPHVKQLVEQICVLLSLPNDLLSLKKELSAGSCAINAVAALLLHGGPDDTMLPLDEVVARICDQMANAVVAFDTAAGTLLREMDSNEELHGLARRLVDGFKAIATGLLEFTCVSDSCRRGDSDYSIQQYADRPQPEIPSLQHYQAPAARRVVGNCALNSFEQQVRMPVFPSSFFLGSNQKLQCRKRSFVSRSLPCNIASSCSSCCPPSCLFPDPFLCIYPMSIPERKTEGGGLNKNKKENRWEK